MKHQRSTRTKTLATLAASSIAAIGLAGCSSGQEETGEIDTEAPVTLTVQQQTSQEALFGAIAEQFEAEYPNVTVELETVSQEQKTGSNLAVLGSADPPDVGMIPLNSEVYTQLLLADALAPLDDIWDEADLDNRYGETVADYLTSTGAPYAGVFAQTIYNVVWYNPQLFEQAGITAPADHRIESVDQLLEFADKLQAIGVSPLQMAGGSGYHASWMVDALLPTSASEEQMANYLSAHDPEVEITAEYTDPEFVQVLETLARFNEEGLYQNGFLGQDAPTALAPFLGGQAGMSLGGNFNTADFEGANLDWEPGWLVLPPVDGGTPTVQTQYFGDAIGVPAQSDQVAWAKEFVKFALSDEIQGTVIIDNGLVPAVNSLPAEAMEGLPPLVQELLDDAAANGSQPGWTSTVPGGFGQQFIDPLIQQMYSNQLTPEEVAQQQQDHLLEYREQQ